MLSVQRCIGHVPLLATCTATDPPAICTQDRNCCPAGNLVDGCGDCYDPTQSSGGVWSIVDGQCCVTGEMGADGSCCPAGSPVDDCGVCGGNNECNVVSTVTTYLSTDSTTSTPTPTPVPRRGLAASSTDWSCWAIQVRHAPG